MKVIIAGSRTITDPALVAAAVEASGFEVTNVISGGARGVDRMGEAWARAHRIPLTIFPADWKRYGKIAGLIRNQEMAKHADALIAIWDGQSTGTGHMITSAKWKGLPVYVHRAA